MEISQRGLDLIKSEEAYRGQLYLDAVGVVTIGYGHAVKDPKTNSLLRGGEGMKRAKAQFPRALSMDEAELLLKEDVKEFVENVFNLTKSVKLTQEMFDALVSFDYNTGKLGRSTLLLKLKNMDYWGAAKEFDVWIYGTVGGAKKKLGGLVRRRGKERKLFEEGIKKLEAERALSQTSWTITGAQND